MPHIIHRLHGKNIEGAMTGFSWRWIGEINFQKGNFPEINHASENVFVSEMRTKIAWIVQETAG